MIDLGRNLGLRVVAEGVEDEATRAGLTGAGCHLAQGFLWSRPAPPDLVQSGEDLTRPLPGDAP